MTEQQILKAVYSQLTIGNEDRAKPQEITFGRGETILLADGNDILLNLGRTLLQKLNYQVVTAKNENQIIEKFKIMKQKINLLILDTTIPKKGGQDILNQIQNYQPATKALFYTTCDLLVDPACRQKIGRIPVIAKPYSIIAFSRIIDQTLH